MGLRIIVNGNSLSGKGEVGLLKTLFQSTTLLIQGSSDIKTFILKDGRHVFLAGSVLGRRTSQNEIVPCRNALATWEELIRQSSIEKCQEFLEGRFLLVVAGPEDRCSFCADHYGRYDVYYQTFDEIEVFASDLSLLPISPAFRGFDQMALAHSLTVFGFRPPKRHTLYQGIRRLGVGEMVHIDHDRVEFSETPFVPLHVGKYGEVELNRHADILIDAIKVRGSRYGNVVYLSSGWDSTTILACLVHIFGATKVRAAIVRMLFSERSGVFNKFEIDRAQAMADYYGVTLDILDLDVRHQPPPQLERFIPMLKAQQSPSLTCLSHGILADFVASTTNGAEAVFAGEISDGAYNLGFSQYTTIFHPVLSFREYSDKMASYLFGPTFLSLLQNGQFLNDPVYELLRNRANKAIFDQPATGAPNIRTRQLMASFFLRARRLPLWSVQNSKMLTRAGAAEYSKVMEFTYLNQASKVASQDTLYAWYLYLYNSFHWQSSTVVTLPLTAEVNGFTLALPFWDSRLQEFLSAMPETWGRGLDLNPTKYPLKWMLKNRIDYPMYLQEGPHSYLYDVDHSFTPAAEVIYHSALAPYFRDLLRPRNYRELLSADIFDLAYIDSLVDRYLDGVEIPGGEFNDLVSLCWHMAVGWYGG
ncbi:MAG: hypothetical protein JRJ77_11100 [Deltaproteobacteria bacterium]|nr:hypothetical protein [Deltaproteobacteria bacterium]